MLVALHIFTQIVLDCAEAPVKLRERVAKAGVGRTSPRRGMSGAYAPVAEEHRSGAHPRVAT